MIIDRDEIESVMNFYLPQKVDAKTWDEERAHAIETCADVISRRIKERSENE